MSQQYHGREMDRPIPGSVRRARERAQAGLPRDAQLPRQPPPMGADFSQRDPGVAPSRPPPAAVAAAPAPAKISQLPLRQLPLRQPPVLKSANMSRPMNTPPQWPFPDPSASVALANTGPSQSTPAARFQPELKKTPNPIRAPPTLNQYQPQDPTSFFSAHSSFAVSPQDSMDGYDTMSPAQASSRRTTSSVGSIPDFPLPAITSVPTPPRRSGILGPPPSSRRGLSTMYSSASLVSPIPEESPRSRSRGSYASSAAMPETWGTSSSPLASPGDSAAFFDDSSSERSRDSTLDDFEFLDEPKLDRSDSRGEAGKADFVKTASANNMLNPFEDGAGYVDASRYIDTSTSDLTAFPLAKPDPAASLSNLSQTGELTPDAILRAYAAASLSNPSGVQAGAGPSSDTRVPPSVMSAIRAADERSSLTSLPDLIRRATRLVSMIDKGRRPGSRIDDLSAWGSSDNTGSRDGDGSLSGALVSKARRGSQSEADNRRLQTC